MKKHYLFFLLVSIPLIMVHAQKNQNQVNAVFNGPNNSVDNISGNYLVYASGSNIYAKYWTGSDWSSPILVDVNMINPCIHYSPAWGLRIVAEQSQSSYGYREIRLYRSTNGGASYYLETYWVAFNASSPTKPVINGGMVVWRQSDGLYSPQVDGAGSPLPGTNSASELHALSGYSTENSTYYLVYKEGNNIYFDQYNQPNNGSTCYEDSARYPVSNYSYNTNPSVACYPLDSRVGVVWEHYGYLFFRERVGRTWGNEIQLPSHGTTGHARTKPQISYDQASGKVIVVFQCNTHIGMVVKDISSANWPGVINMGEGTDPSITNAYSYQTPKTVMWTSGGTINTVNLAPMTIPAGTISNFNWSGIVNVTGSATLNSGATLNIAPGTVVLMANNSTLTINGVVNAQGTSGKYIAFTSAVGSTPSWWSRVRVNAGSSIFKYCTFSYASYGLYLSSANSGNSVIVENCTFESNGYGLYSSNSKAQVKSCEMRDNSTYGVYSSANPDINLIGNLINYNTLDGVVALSGDQMDLFGNVIQLNSRRGLYAASSAIVYIGHPYQWSGYNTIRSNGGDEVYAGGGSPGPQIYAEGSSIHHASGYEVYNSVAGNPELGAYSCYWDVNGCQSGGPGPIYIYNPFNYLPPWDGETRTYGSPIGKVSTPEPSDNIPWILDPRISGTEKVKRCKEIIAANASSKEGTTALVWLYNIARTDYVNDNLDEKKAFFTYLQTLKKGSGDSELGKLALRYMIIWKMLEGDASSVVKLSKEALKSFSGDERQWVLVDLARTYLQHGQVPEASTLLQELREKFADGDGVVADLEVDVVDVNRQLEDGLMNREEIPNSLDPDLAAPTEYSISQNYPNPFNPVTIINYQVPKDGLVTLKVYDVLGREVRTLVDEYKTTGYYSATFNASHLASGMYIYKIFAQPVDGGRKDVFTAVRKMLVVK